MELRHNTAERLEIRWISVNGLSIRTARRTNSSGGTPLVIFNGIGAALEMLLPFIDAVPDIDVITFDAPGAGRSAAPSLPWRFSHYAKAAARVMDEYGVATVNLAGISWGGALAQQFVRQYPERVDRLILGVTTPGHIMVPGKLSALLHMSHPRRYVDPDYLKRVAPMLYGGKMRTNRLSASEYAELMTPPSQLGYYYQALAGFGWTSLPWLHRIGQPTLVIQGEDDPIVPAANGRILAALIPRARLMMVDCGHLCMLTHASEVGAEVERFLAGRPAAAA